MRRLLTSARALFAVAIASAVIYLLALPALPEGSAEDAQFVASTAVAVVGLAALGLGVRAWARDRS